MNDIFSDIFLGEYVSILIDYTSMTETERGTESSVVTSEGYVKDADDTFVYLSEDNTDVCKAVSFKYIISISISNPTDVMTELLENMPDPLNENDIN